MTRGKQVSDLAAVFFVDRKVPLRRLKGRDRLPGTIKVGNKKVHTDVVRVKPMKFLRNPDPNHQRVRNPILMGLSIGICPVLVDNCISRGTAGAVVEGYSGNRNRYVLSAKHVLQAQGLDVIQPWGPVPVTVSGLHPFFPWENGHNHIRLPLGQPPDRRDNIGSVVRLAGGDVDAGSSRATLRAPRSSR